MRKIRFSLMFMLCSFTTRVLAQQPAPFTPGNIVVYRVGDGISTLGFDMTKVYLDEYTTSGNFVQSIQMPVTGQKVTALGSTFQMGGMTLSADGRYLVVPGFNTTPGTFDSFDRSIALVDHNGSVSSVTVVSNPNYAFPVSAASDNGNNLWLGDQGGAGVEYCPVGANSTVVLNAADINDLNIAEGQLYSSDELGLYTVGTGLPMTPGQTKTGLSQYPNPSKSHQFAFADLNASIPGVDVLYVADQTTVPAGSGGIRKYSLSSSGVWNSNGAVGTGIEGYRGLTIKVSANVVTIFATRNGPNTVVGGGELVSLTDNSGHNGTLSGIPVVLASAASPNKKAFRGVTRVPLNCPSVTGLRIINISSSQATLTWNPNLAGSGYEYFVDQSPIPTGSGIDTSGTTVTVEGLSNGVTYFAHVRTFCGDQGASEWMTVQFTAECQPPAVSTMTINMSGDGSTNVKWRKIFGDPTYEYLISSSGVPPASGALSTPDTSIVVTNLDPISQYYVHVRSSCGNGAFSVWVTKPFATGCFTPVIHLNLTPNQAEVVWKRINNVNKYEYALTYSIAKPLSGSYTSDSFYVMTKLKDGSSYFFHVRSVCVDGSVSDWSTVDFQMQGLVAYPNPVNEILYIKGSNIGNGNGQVVIYDATGRLVKKVQLTANSATIDTRAWSSGIYLMIFDEGRNKYSVKIMKR